MRNHFLKVSDNQLILERNSSFLGKESEYFSVYSATLGKSGFFVIFSKKIGKFSEMKMFLLKLVDYQPVCEK